MNSLNDMKFIIDAMILPKLQFTDNKRDFVQLKVIHNYVQEHSYKMVAQCALYDILEEQFLNNYNPGCCNVIKKDINKYTLYIIVYESYL